MKNKIALVLVAALLAVPTAVANSVDYDTGAFIAGKMTGSFQSSIDVGIQGTLDTIDLQTGKLIKTTAGCPPGSQCFSFVGGLVKVLTNAGTIFADSIAGGIAISADGSASIIATLMPNSTVVSGTVSSSFEFDGRHVTSGSTNVAISTTAAAVPELGTLALLGSGVSIMAAGIRKRFLPQP